MDTDTIPTESSSSRPEAPAGLSGKALFWAGIALVMVGLVALFRYSIEQGWFGPAVRLGLGVGVSTLLVLMGVIVDRPVYGRLLAGAGIAGLYASAWASWGRYGFVDETGAMIQLAMVAALGIGLALREQSDILAALGFVGAGLAPVLIGGTMAWPFGDAFYLIAVLVASSVLYVVRGWWATHLAACSAAGVAVLAMAFDATGAGPGAVAAIVAFGVAGFVVPRVAAVLSDDMVVDHDVLVVLTSVVPFSVWGLVRVVEQGSATALGHTAVFVGLVFGLAQFIAFGLTRDRLISLLDAALGVGLVGTAIANYSSVVVTYPALVALGFGAAAVLVRLDNVAGRIVGGLFAALGSLIWLEILLDGDATWSGDLVALVVAGIGVAAMKRSDRVGPGTMAYLMGLASIAVHGSTADTGWVTAAWATVGLAGVVGGRLIHSRIATGFGLGTVAIAVAKLMFIDLATADPLLRVGLAIGIGLALLAVGYWIGDSEILGTRSDEISPQPDVPAG